MGRVRDEKDERQHHETLAGLLHGWKKETRTKPAAFVANPDGFTKALAAELMADSKNQIQSTSKWRARSPSLPPGRAIMVI